MQANTTGATAISIALKRRNKEKRSETFCSERFCLRQQLVLCKKQPFRHASRATFPYTGTANCRRGHYQRSKTSTSHRTQTNVQQPFLNTACYCELAVQHSFFETSQSCVSTKVTLSHRFKSSPAISGKVAVPDAVGYMMLAGHFRRNLVSSGDLNRPRSPEVRKPLGYSPFFSYKRKE